MNHTMSNFFHEFAAAAQAMEELPIVKEALESAKVESADLRGIIQRLELQAIDRKNEIDTLNARIRSLEVERDDAQFQALEEQDRTSAFKRFVEAMFGQAGNLLQASTPTVEATPEPSKIDTKLEDVISGYPYGVPSEAHIDGPMAGHATLGEPVATEASSQNAASTTEPIAAPSTSTSADATMGESAADPTANSATCTHASDATGTEHVGGDTPHPFGDGGGGMAQPLGEGVSVPSDPTQATAPSSESDLSGSQARPKPYEGKRYTDWPAYVPLDLWIDGGGTEADYYAR